MATVPTAYSLQCCSADDADDQHAGAGLLVVVTMLLLLMMMVVVKMLLMMELMKKNVIMLMMLMLVQIMTMITVVMLIAMTMMKVMISHCWVTRSKAALRFAGSCDMGPTWDTHSPDSYAALKSGSPIISRLLTERSPKPFRQQK